MKLIPQSRNVCFGLLILSTPNVMGCGPDFPEQLIPSRKLALAEPPPTWFAREVYKLIDTQRQDLPLVEGESPADQRSTLEVEGLSSEAAQRIEKMRQAEHGDAAYQLGAELPEAVRLYTAAAVDYHLAVPPRDPEQYEEPEQQSSLSPEQVRDLLARAQQRLQAVLALPAEQRQSRELWTHFMLGKMAVQQADEATASREFSWVREHVKAGLADPLGLAVASLGEQARLHIQPGHLAQATQEYVEQFSYGSQSAFVSLRFLAWRIVKHPEWIAEAMQDPLTRRLLTLYVYSQSVGTPFYSMDRYIGQQMAASEEAVDEEQMPSNDVWTPMANALDQVDANNLQGADWMAALAYQRGRYDLAKRFAEHGPQSALSYWVNAKLALRDGNQQQALAAYAEAAKAFPAQTEPAQVVLYAEGDRDGNLLDRVNAEQGVLRLARGEYIQALQHLYSAANQYWPDAAYVAERVLSLDELQAFVQHNAPVAATANSPEQTLTPAQQLRKLLARRLLRAGRVDEAIAYFDDAQQRELAQHYRQLQVKTQESLQTNINKAQAWFELAQFTREHGMELMGYELTPDYAIWDGMYDVGAGPTQLEGDLCSADEQQRFQQSAAQPDVRYHYRVVAAQYASQAADLLPQRSQAFAAVLCEAAHWNINSAPQIAKPLYQRYLKQGAYVDWGKQFAQTCPAPDFSSAHKRLWIEHSRWLWQHPLRWGAGMVVLLVAGWFWRAKKKPETAE